MVKLAVEFQSDAGAPGGLTGLFAQPGVPDSSQSAYWWASLIEKAPP
jgi:hypothetical protein